jgi:hypothetical protein
VDRSTVLAYSREADKIERGPQIYGGPVEITSLRAYRAHHKAARLHFMNVDGRTYWMTPKMMRIHAVVSRQATSEKQTTTLHAIASETGVSAGYVSKVIRRLQGWAMIGASTSRGRYGGIFLWKVKRLVQKLRQASGSFNVSSVLQGREKNERYTEETLNWSRSELEGL